MRADEAGGDGATAAAEGEQQGAHGQGEDDVDEGEHVQGLVAVGGGGGVRKVRQPDSDKQKIVQNTSILYMYVDKHTLPPAKTNQPQYVEAKDKVEGEDGKAQDEDDGVEGVVAEVEAGLES